MINSEHPQRPTMGDTIIIPTDQRRFMDFHLTTAHMCATTSPPQMPDSEFTKNSYLTHFFLSLVHTIVFNHAHQMNNQLILQQASFLQDIPTNQL